MLIYGKFVKCHLFYCIVKQGVKKDLALIKTLVQSMQKEPLISQIVICDQLSCYRSNLKDYKIPRDTRVSWLSTANAWKKRKTLFQKVEGNISWFVKRKNKCIKTLDEDIVRYIIEAEEKLILFCLQWPIFISKNQSRKRNIKALDNGLQKLEKDLGSLAK